MSKNRISEDDFQKALDRLAFPTEAVDPAEDEKIAAFAKMDATDFIDALVKSVGESNGSLAKAITTGFSNTATLLKSMSDRLDDSRAENAALRARVEAIESSPASEPKGSPTAQPLNKTFTTEEGTEKPKVTAAGLTRVQVKKAIESKLSKALASGDRALVAQYGEWNNSITAGIVPDEARLEAFGFYKSIESGVAI